MSTKASSMYMPVLPSNCVYTSTVYPSPIRCHQYKLSHFTAPVWACTYRSASASTSCVYKRTQAYIHVNIGFNPSQHLAYTSFVYAHLQQSPKHLWTSTYMSALVPSTLQLIHVHTCLSSMQALSLVRGVDDTSPGLYQ